MNYINEDITFTFGLIFRTLFYSIFISLMFFNSARDLRIKFKKQINFLILLFAICYLGWLIPLFFDGKNHAGLLEVLLYVWIIFFSYLFVLNNLKKININLNEKKSSILRKSSLILVLFCNAILNFPISGVIWISGFVAAYFHGILSLLLPIISWLFIQTKPDGKGIGMFIISLTLIQFVFGIFLSYGKDGYLADSLSLSLIFILNSLLFIIIGINYYVKDLK